MREWLSGGAPPCQGGGRGFDPRLALLLCNKMGTLTGAHFYCISEPNPGLEGSISRLPPRSLLLTSSEVSAGHPQPVSRFFCLFLRNLVVLVLFMLHFVLHKRAQSRARRFDFSASASVVASLLRKEVSTGHPQPVSRFFCLFLRNLVVLVLFMLHFVLHKRAQSRARRFDFSASASVVASLLRKEVSTGHPQPVSRFF